MHTVIDIIRIVNAVAASIVFGLLVFRGKRNYGGYTLREKVFHNTVLFYSFTAAFSSGATYLIDTNDYVTPFMFLIANVYATRAFISYYPELFAASTGV